MINKELELNINRERILDKLAKNLNIDFVTEGSNLKKLADTFSSESITYANNIDDAIANGFITTMSSDFLERFGEQNSIYRKIYNNISLYSYQEAVNLKVNRIDAMVTEIDKDYVVFKRGDVIYSDDNILIESLQDIKISTINQVQNISILISLINGLNSHSISEDTEFNVVSTNREVVNLFPSFTLTFTLPVGLALLQETEEDYKLRIYESTYVANNGANSLISSIVKEVPFIIYLETDDFKNGRGIKTIYPYTQMLIDEGTDYALDSIILPLIYSNLRGKVLTGEIVEVLKPEALVMVINIQLKDNRVVNNSLLDNLRLTFNRFFSTYKEVEREVLEDFIKSETGISRDLFLDIEIIFTSPYVSEESFKMTSDRKTILVPKGRFLYLAAINQVE